MRLFLVKQLYALFWGGAADPSKRCNAQSGLNVAGESRTAFKLSSLEQYVTFYAATLYMVQLNASRNLVRVATFHIMQLYNTLLLYTCCNLTHPLTLQYRATSRTGTEHSRTLHATTVPGATFNATTLKNTPLHAPTLNPTPLHAR